MKTLQTALVLTIVATLACSQKNHSPRPSIADDAKARLNKPVNCATAKQDIQDLEDDKASTAKQIISGVRSVVPVAAATGVLMGDYEDRTAVATGDYNDQIDGKIDQIKFTCGIRSAS